MKNKNYVGWLISKQPGRSELEDATYKAAPVKLV